MITQKCMITHKHSMKQDQQTLCLHAEDTTQTPAATGASQPCSPRDAQHQRHPLCPRGIAWVYARLLVCHSSRTSAHLARQYRSSTCCNSPRSLRTRCRRCSCCRTMRCPRLHALRRGFPRLLLCLLLHKLGGCRRQCCHDQNDRAFASGAKGKSRVDPCSEGVTAQIRCCWEWSVDKRVR